MAISDAQRQKRRDARALLEGFWPAAFNFSKPRPLKLGIFEDMVADAQERGLPFDAMMLKVAMKSYTSRYVYQKALSSIVERTGLDGSPCGEVSAEQREYAKIQIRRIDAKAKKRKSVTEDENATKADGSHPAA